MPTGMVKWFNETKNYGFIIPDEGGRDLFFHRSDMQAHLLREGQPVNYSIEEGRKGPVAVDVTPLDGEGNFNSIGYPSSEHGRGYRRYNNYSDEHEDDFRAADVPPRRYDEPKDDFKREETRPARPLSPDFRREETSPARPPSPSFRRDYGTPPGGRISLLVSDAKSICDSAEELALQEDETADADALHSQLLNLSVLVRTAREKLDDALDELAATGL